MLRNPLCQGSQAGSRLTLRACRFWTFHRVVLTMVHHGAMFSREVVEAMMKSEVLQYSSLLDLRLTCKAFHDAITGHLPAAIDCNMVPNPNRLQVSDICCKA